MFCDYNENTPFVPTSLSNDNSNKKMLLDVINCINSPVIHKGENCHSNKLKKELDSEKLILNLKTQIKNIIITKKFGYALIIGKSMQNIIN